MPTAEHIVAPDIDSSDWEALTAEQVLALVFERYGADAALSCSFGGTSGMVLVDMAARIFPGVRVMTLDTDFLFPETYELIEKVEARYGFRVQRVKPGK